MRRYPSTPEGPTVLPTGRDTSSCPYARGGLFAGNVRGAAGRRLPTLVFVDQIESVFGSTGYTKPGFTLIVHSPGMVARDLRLYAACRVATGHQQCQSGDWTSIPRPPVACKRGTGALVSPTRD